LGSELRETSVQLRPAAPEASNDAPGHLSKKALPATAGGSSSRDGLAAAALEVAAASALPLAFASRAGSEVREVRHIPDAFPLANGRMYR
jgi:hypothetical protein